MVFEGKEFKKTLKSMSEQQKQKFFKIYSEKYNAYMISLSVVSMMQCCYQTHVAQLCYKTTEL